MVDIAYCLLKVSIEKATMKVRWIIPATMIARQQTSGPSRPASARLTSGCSTGTCYARLRPPNTWPTYTTNQRYSEHKYASMKISSLQYDHMWLSLWYLRQTNSAVTSAYMQARRAHGTLYARTHPNKRWRHSVTNMSYSVCSMGTHAYTNSYVHNKCPPRKLSLTHKWMISTASTLTLPPEKYLESQSSLVPAQQPLDCWTAHIPSKGMFWEQPVCVHNVFKLCVCGIHTIKWSLVWFRKHLRGNKVQQVCCSTHTHVLARLWNVWSYGCLHLQYDIRVHYRKWESSSLPHMIDWYWIVIGRSCCEHFVQGFQIPKAWRQYPSCFHPQTNTCMVKTITIKSTIYVLHMLGAIILKPWMPHE